MKTLFLSLVAMAAFSGPIAFAQSVTGTAVRSTDYRSPQPDDGKPAKALVQEVLVLAPGEMSQEFLSFSLKGHDLQDKVNAWLADNKDSIKVNRIGFFVDTKSYRGSLVSRATLTIIYEKK